jgi:FAD/FMN-containing dehydrogenase
LAERSPASNLIAERDRTPEKKELPMVTDMLADVLRPLRARCRGAVLVPGDPGWDAARASWQLAVDQYPAAVAYPESEQDVVEIVQAARELELRVAPQATGHNAAPLGPLDDTILLRTGAMRGVRIDPARGTARVRAGALWQDVTTRAGAYGLATLAGSSPNVGVAGYSLGGGVGWFGRRYGLQANHLTAVELVTADGHHVRADHEYESDLFWALRGGGGSFGVVTALEFELLPVRSAYAGALVWDWREAGPVLLRFSEWARSAPDLITTAARILQIPDVPTVSSPLRGRQIVMIDGAFLGDPADADRVLAPLRSLRPELDTFTTMPAASLQRLHGDPEHPTAAVSEHRMLAELPREAVEAFLTVAGPRSGSPLLTAELRQLGGALGRRPESHGALSHLDGEFAMIAAGLALTDEMALANMVAARELSKALEPWCNARPYLNFEEHTSRAASFFDEETYGRLRSIKARVDPRRVIRANHPVEP